MSKFNPYAYERDTVDLGEHGKFTVRDSTKSVRAELRVVFKAIEDIGDDAEDAEVVGLVCSMIEKMLHGAPEAGVAVKLQADYDADKLGMNSLTRLLGFLSESQSGVDRAGEG